MALWRFGRGWSEATLRRYLAELRTRSPNFTAAPEEMTPARGWLVDGAATRIGREPPGPPVPGNLYERSKQALVNYDFSDPRIVVGHFDPQEPLVGRDMLLEIKVLGIRYLNGVRVHGLHEESDGGQSQFGFRYDTLEGHIEQGFEWFLLQKRHATGEIWFKIEAHWRLGQFPNWWSRVGFLVIGNPVRALWRRMAVERLRRLAHQPVQKLTAAPGHLAHRGDVTPERTVPSAQQ